MEKLIRGPLFKSKAHYTYKNVYTKDTPVYQTAKNYKNPVAWEGPAGFGGRFSKASSS